MENTEITNKAIEIMDKTAPFLQPMPSDDEALIKTVAQFALEITPRQNAVLTRLQLLTHEDIPPTEKTKIAEMVKLYMDRKRYHDAKFFISDTIASLSWKKFVNAGQMEGKVNKNSQG